MLGSLLDPIAWWARATDREIQEPAFERDVEFLRRMLPLMDLWSHYFDAEVRGFEHLPARGPMLLVGNHSGGILTPGTTAFFAAWYRHRGLDDPLVALAIDAAFGIPGFRSLMRRIGEVPANRRNAGRALDAGAAVLVYPGGEREVFRPWSERNRIDFAGHMGFVALALQHQVPVIPVVSHGGHSSTIILTRGEALAKFFRLDRIRVTNAPIAWQIPWGVSPAGLPGVPLPAKITIEILPPMPWADWGPEAATDPAIVARGYREITDVMQGTLTRLVHERPYPLLSRVANGWPLA